MALRLQYHNFLSSITSGFVATDTRRKPACAAPIAGLFALSTDKQADFSAPEPPIHSLTSACLPVATCFPDQSVNSSTDSDQSIIFIGHM